MKLRAKLPNETYFHQENQYLTSFLRRVLFFYEVEHPKYMKVELEDIVEIKIDNKWIKLSDEYPSIKRT